MILFYCAHWQTYVSGTLRFGKVDVTEAQIAIMLIHLISAVFGPSIWMVKVSCLFANIFVVGDFFPFFQNIILFKYLFLSILFSFLLIFLI